MATSAAFQQKQGFHKLDLVEIATGLFNEGLITEQQLENFQVKAGFQDSLRLSPMVIIADQGLKSAKAPHQPISQEFIAQWISEKAAVPYLRIDPLKTDVAAVTGVFSYAYAERNKLLPVSVSSTCVTIGTAEPFDLGWKEELSRIIRKDIDIVLLTPADISRYLVEFFNVSRSVLGAASNKDLETYGDIGNLEQMIELGKSGNLDANDHHVVNIVDWLLQYAFDQRASDIHIEPRRDQGNIRFRIDGMLHHIYEMPSAVMAAVTSRIKILGRMDLAEKRRPLDGRLKTRRPNGAEVELRLSTIPTAFGEKLVMRIFDPDVLVKNFSDLGFGKNEVKMWQEMIQQPNGIILVTGPTGSGKTTTLYSTLKYLAKPEVNVCTIEDPIEMVVSDFNQMQVQHNIDLGFAEGVRALMRQDPDIIMVGEIRDLETAEMAIQAALTGHLVISTLHTNDAASAVTRLLDIGVPYYLISATVLGIVGQRLVRTLCPHCKKPIKPDVQQWNELSRPWKTNLPEKVNTAVGCIECRQTGYLGRTAIYEIMMMSRNIRKIITPQTDLAALRQEAIQEGLRPLRLSGIQKVGNGVTSLEEVARVAPQYSED